MLNHIIKEKKIIVPQKHVLKFAFCVTSCKITGSEQKKSMSFLHAHPFCEGKFRQQL